MNVYRENLNFKLIHISIIALTLIYSIEIRNSIDTSHFICLYMQAKSLVYYVQMLIYSY